MSEVMNSSGVNVPSVRLVDALQGVLGVDWIEGKTLRQLLPAGAEEARPLHFSNEDKEVDPLSEFRISKGSSSLPMDALKICLRRAQIR